MHSDAHIAGMSHGSQGTRRPLSRRHLLMLALALEVLAIGFSQAAGYQPPSTIVVEPPSVPGHMIT